MAPVEPPGTAPVPDCWAEATFGVASKPTQRTCPSVQRPARHRVPRAFRAKTLLTGTRLVRKAKADKPWRRRSVERKRQQRYPLKLATWNINSIRARLDAVLGWLQTERPDVLCMQETKVEDDDFPSDELQMLGYAVAMSGQPTYNGVAIASRLPMKEIQIGLLDAPEDADKRLIAATIGGIRVLSAYVPNGRTVSSPAFKEKLGWLAALRRTLTEREHGRDIFLGGDFNVASDERDVFDPDAFRGKVHFHPDERRELDELRKLGFVDAFRKFEERGGLYSWWDYRAGGLRKNQGLRIDYAFLSAGLATRCKACRMDHQPRHADKPSDHIPVVIELE
jgi:exodeoxyribonuclease III